MDLTFALFFSSILLGVGLAMDAFSVSLANGLNYPCMKKGKICTVAGVFAFFQALMPFIGWVLITTVISYFEALEKFIPWIALALLGFIGGKMIIESIKSGDDEESTAGEKLTIRALLVQSVANLCAAFEDAPEKIWRLSWQGTVGNPVLFPKSTFAELLNLPVGKGGGAVVKKHPDLVDTVEVADERELVDVDTPEILASLL